MAPISSLKASTVFKCFLPLKPPKISNLPSTFNATKHGMHASIRRGVHTVRGLFRKNSPHQVETLPEAQRKPKEVPRFISQSPQNHLPRFHWKKPPIPTHLGQHMEPWPTQRQADFENHEVWGVPSNWRGQWSSPVLECSGITEKIPNFSEDEGGRMQQELSIIWRRALFREKNT